MQETFDSLAMRCLLEQMRDNPGAIASSAGAGAAAWALARIETLEADLRRGDRAFRK